MYAYLCVDISTIKHIHLNCLFLRVFNNRNLLKENVELSSFCNCHMMQVRDKYECSRLFLALSPMQGNCIPVVGEAFQYVFIPRVSGG